MENKPFSGILIHKTDSVTGKGIQGVTFLLYDSTNTPVGQYTSDNSGYVYIENLTVSGRYYLRELENEGYVPDTQMKTVYVTAGEILFGSAGLKLVSSRDAKKAYTHATAAALRMKESVMETVTTVQENAADILASAKDLNAQRAEQETVDAEET